MEALLLVVMAALGTLLPVVPPEATATAVALRTGWSPVLVGALAALGQCLTYAAVYVGGEALARRWRWLERQVVLVRERFGARLERGALLVTVAAGLVGVPPGLGLAAVAGSFEISLVRMLPVLFVCRLLRFALLVSFGRSLLPALWEWIHR